MNSCHPRQTMTSECAERQPCKRTLPPFIVVTTTDTMLTEQVQHELGVRAIDNRRTIRPPVTEGVREPW